MCVSDMTYKQPIINKLTMYILCSQILSGLIRRGIETILDGSEHSRFEFGADSLSLQSVDCLSVCVFQFDFPKNRFLKYDVEEKKHSVKFETRGLYRFLKKYSNLVIAFRKDSSVFTVQLIVPLDKQESISQSYKIQESGDMTEYYDIPIDNEYTRIRISPEAFTNIVLEMTIGGGYTLFTLEKNTFSWYSKSETGSIGICCRHNNQEFQEDRIHIVNTYLTKFLKQTVNIASTCIGLVIRVAQDGPMFLCFDIDRYSTLTVVIAPCGV